MHKTFCVSLIFTLLTGCVSIYEGRGPNFSHKGTPEATAEYDRFKLEEPDAFRDRLRVAKMNGTNYELRSLPFVADVSPVAATEMDRAKMHNYVAFGLIGAALLVAITQPSPLTDGGAVLFYGSLATSIGFSIYSMHVQSNAIDQYNNDLHEKLAPSVRVGFKY
ncbi:MAG TPA: hypothetical protein VM432_11030 [Bdellovibrionales bacterium]|nr:hypothetical protein [Bdellovibrionales bacterium]